MKEYLRETYQATKENWHWLVFALAIALMLLLAKVNATELEDFMSKHNLKLPPIVQQEIEKQNLVAAYGMMDKQNNIFTIYILKKDDIPEMQIDVSQPIIKVHFYLNKKRIVVEGMFCKNSHQGGKCWPNACIERVFTFYDYWRL